MDAVKRRLLYVEDDRTVARAVKRLVESLGWVVSAYETREIATEAITKMGGGDGTTGIYDAVLADWDLGFGETSAPIVRHAVALGLPVRIMSGSDPVPGLAHLWLAKTDTDGLRTWLRSVGADA